MAMRKILCLLLALVLICCLSAACATTEPGESDKETESVAESVADGETSEEAESALPNTPESDDETAGSDATGDATTAAGGDTTASAEGNTGDNGTTVAGDKNTTTQKGGKTTTKKGGKTTTTTSRTSRALTTFKGDLNNMEGYEFVIGSIWATTETGWIAKENSSAEIKKLQTAYEKIEKQLNCKIEFKDFAVTTLLTSIVKAYQAGDKFCDALEISPAYFYALVNNHYFVPLSDSSVLNLNDPKWESSAKAFTTFNNKIYGVSWDSLQFTAPARQVIFYNKALWETYGTGEDLYDCVRNNTWTFDKMEQAMNAVVSKTNGSVTGMVAYDLPGAARMFAVANGGTFITEKNGKYTWTGTTNAVANGISFAHNLYSKNLLVDRGDSDMISVVASNFMKDKIFMLSQDYYYATRFFSSGMKSDYGILPVPKGPDVAKDAPYKGIYSDSRFFCLLDSVDRDKACRILDVFADLTKKPSENSWEKIALKNDLRDSASLEMVKLCVENPVIDMLGQVTGVQAVVNEAFKEAVMKGSVASKLASVKTQAQSSLDDQFKQNK